MPVKLAPRGVRPAALIGASDRKQLQQLERITRKVNSCRRLEPSKACCRYPIKRAYQKLAFSLYPEVGGDPVETRL